MGRGSYKRLNIFYHWNFDDKYPLVAPLEDYLGPSSLQPESLLPLNPLLQRTAILIAIRALHAATPYHGFDGHDRCD